MERWKTRTRQLAVAVALLAAVMIRPSEAGTIQTSPGNGTLDYGFVRIGTSGILNITAFRTGPSAGGALSGTFPGASAPFSPSTTLAFGPIANNGAANGVTTSYSFAPTGHSFFSQSLSITSNLGSTPLNLTGTGVGPIFASTPAPGSTFNFPGVELGQSATLPLSISNISNDPNGGNAALTNLTLLSATLTGPNANSFSLTGFTPSTVLTEGGLLNLLVNFAPLGPLGPQTATLTIQTDQGAALGSPGASFSYNLQGVATTPEPASLLVWTAIASLSVAGNTMRRLRRARRSN